MRVLRPRGGRKVGQHKVSVESGRPYAAESDNLAGLPLAEIACGCPPSLRLTDAAGISSAKAREPVGWSATRSLQDRQ